MKIAVAIVKFHRVLHGRRHKFQFQQLSRFPYHDRKNGNRRTLHTPFCVTANQLWTGFVLGNVEPKQLLQWWRIKVQRHANSLWHLCPLNIVNESMHSPPCMYVAVQSHIINLMWVEGLGICNFFVYFFFSIISGNIHHCISVSDYFFTSLLAL